MTNSWISLLVNSKDGVDFAILFTLRGGVKKRPPGWTNRNFKPNPPGTKRYAYKEIKGYRYYDGHHRRPEPQRKVIYKPQKKIRL